MKVRIQFSVDIDEHAWAQRYGVVACRQSEFREGVKQTLEQLVRNHLADEGVGS
ncbi:hypothetical protein [Prescottella equi]|uniref:hypothetical protein n=1 Tax=Rhodococcus hoagii TaxID=43767 RepID=UPI0015859315|nr:hypothetical protein [Prescottella equi]